MGPGAGAEFAACSRWATVLGEADGIALVTGAAPCGGGMEAAAGARAPVVVSGSVIVGEAAAASPLLPVLGESAASWALHNCRCNWAKEVLRA